jgi:hypothetical protein
MLKIPAKDRGRIISWQSQLAVGNEQLATEPATSKLLRNPKNRTLDIRTIEHLNDEES